MLIQKYILFLVLFYCFGWFLGCESHNSFEIKEKTGDEISWDFDGESAGNLPHSFSQERGQWRILEDTNAPSGNKVLAQTSADRHGSYFNLVVIPDNKYADLELDVKFKAVAGSEDQGGGPVFRYQNRNNYYIARVNPLENDFRVYKVVNGNRQLLASANVKVTSQKYHSIKILAHGSHIQCWYNGQSYLNVEDTTFQNGAIGLWTKADAVTYFDDLRASPIQDHSKFASETDNSKRDQQFSAENHPMINVFANALNLNDEQRKEFTPAFTQYLMLLQTGQPEFEVKEEFVNKTNKFLDQTQQAKLKEMLEWGMR